MDNFTVKANQLLLKIAENELKYIRKQGHARAGSNGPYCNIDTPVRNSGHYLILFSYLHSLTQKTEYLDAVYTLADYLAQKSNYGISGSIRHRKDYRFDQTNGLVGQAWTMEALIEAFSMTKKEYYLQLAEKIYYAQRFEKNSALWHVTDCNGDEGFDLVFNHQLWFAACASMIYEHTKDRVIGDNIQSFLDAADSQYFTIHDNGLIIHKLNYSLTEREKEINRVLSRKRKLISLLRQPVTTIRNKIINTQKDRTFLLGLEEGYHLFDLYGFAILKKNVSFSGHPIFQSDKLKASIEYINHDEHIFGLEKPVGGEVFNKFAFAYNSPAFEYPFVAKVLSPRCSIEVCNSLLEYQTSMTYENTTQSFSNNVADPITLTARSYELVRFLRL